MDPILKALQAAAKFAKTHAVVTAAAVTTAGVGGYVAYDHYNEAERAANGTVVKQGVAVNDKNGDLSVKMRGLGKDAAAPKANEGAKADAGDASKKLSEALSAAKDAAKDADIKAEAEKAVEPKNEQPAVQPEATAAAETAAAYNTDSNVLDGGGSAAFKPARFTTSGSGSAVYEQNRGNKTAAKTAVGGAKPIGKTAFGAVKPAQGGGKAEAAASGKAASGEVKTTKSGGEGGDASKGETGKEASSETKGSSNNETGETGHASNGEGATASTATVTPMKSVDDTVSTVASTPKKESKFARSFEPLVRNERSERVNLRAGHTRPAADEALRRNCLNALKEAFKKEADCDVDTVVSPSDRKKAGIASTYVMKLAAEADKRVKCVTLDVDEEQTVTDLVAFLTSLGKRNKEGNLNSNVSFVLPNGSRFLKGDESIDGVALKAESFAVRITFPKAAPVASDTKKPDTKKPTGGTKKKKSSFIEALGGEFSLGKPTSGKKLAEDIAVTKRPALPKAEKKPTGDTVGKTTDDITANETPDWMQVLSKNAEEEAKAARRAKYLNNNDLFKPNGDGFLVNRDLWNGLQQGFIKGDEYIERVLKYNEEQAKKPEAGRKPILRVPLLDDTDYKPIVRLSADEMTRAKGLVFITDKAGAEDAEKDEKRFITKFTLKHTLAWIFVLSDDGKLPRKQEELLNELEKEEEAQRVQQMGAAKKAFEDAPDVRERRNSFNVKTKERADLKLKKQRETIGMPQEDDRRQPKRRKSFDDAEEEEKKRKEEKAEKEKKKREEEEKKQKLLAELNAVLKTQGGDIALNAKESNVLFEYADILLDDEFFNARAGHVITLNCTDTKDNEAFDSFDRILEERGLEQEKGEGYIKFTAAFALPDLKYDRLPSVWLNKNDTRNSSFHRMKDVHFLHRLQPDDCPEWVRAELPNFDKDRDLILDAVCYAGEDDWKSSHTLALKFGDWAPETVTQWTQGTISIQNLQVYEENMVTVTRDDDGVSALLKFNVQNADAGGADGWFLCECECGEGDQKTKHRIVLHVFFAGEQPKSIAFEEIKCPSVQFGTATNEDENIPPADARTETLRSFFRDAAKVEMADYKDGMFSPPENDMWSLYLRNGLLSASELVRAISEYNDKESDENPRIGIINLRNVNICSNADIVYFSPENIRALNGVSVRIYETERKEEFKDAGLKCEEVTTGEKALLVSAPEKKDDKKEEKQKEEEQNDDEEQEEEVPGEDFEREKDSGNKGKALEEQIAGEEEIEERDDEDDNEEEGNNENNDEQTQNVNEPRKEKLTLDLLWTPDNETMELFAEMDLKAFLDKAKADLTEAGKDPRDARINFVRLCGDSEDAKAKITFDVLLQYPLWTYRIGKEGSFNQTILKEEEDDKLRKLDGKLLFYDKYENICFVCPILSPANNILAVEGDLKYLFEHQVHGLDAFAQSLAYHLDEGKASISVIDFADVKIRVYDKDCFKYFAPYPVVLSNLDFSTISDAREIEDESGNWELEYEGITFIKDINGFKVCYKPSGAIDSDFVDIPAFLKNLKRALKDNNIVVNNAGLSEAVDALTPGDFRYRPAVINGDGTAVDSGRQFLFSTNRTHIHNLINGMSLDEKFESQWSKFAEKLQHFDKKYYKSLIVFFLCWHGCPRVDFSSFSNDNFDNWQKGLNITYGRVLENLKVQEIWNKCLEESDDIPNKGDVKAMFGDLKGLCDKNEVLLNMDIKDPKEIKAFLKSIKDWEFWRDSISLYVTTKHNRENECACYTRDSWKDYQRWRFKQRFVHSLVLSQSETKPIEACKQMNTQWKDLCTWKYL